MAGWMKTPLGTEVDLGPGHIVLDGEPAPPPQKGGTDPPIFGSCLLWPYSGMDQDATWYRGGPRLMPHCARWELSSRRKKGDSPQLLAHVSCGQMGTQLPPRKGHGSPLFSAHIYCGHGRPSQLLLSPC